MDELLLATTNQGKIKEFETFFQQHKLSGIKYLTLKDFSEIQEDVEESAPDFFGNALLKARSYHIITGRPTLAEDSGLVVPALKGEPGIFSARYAGLNKNTKDNVDLLLSRMCSIEDRRAYFISCIVLMISESLFLASTGYCHGMITKNPIGDSGFGYDPIFLLPHLGLTTAQLTAEQKNTLSARGEALKQLLPYLRSSRD